MGKIHGFPRPKWHEMAIGAMAPSAFSPRPPAPWCVSPGPKSSLCRPSPAPPTASVVQWVGFFPWENPWLSLENLGKTMAENGWKWGKSIGSSSIFRGRDHFHTWIAWDGYFETVLSALSAVSPEFLCLFTSSSDSPWITGGGSSRFTFGVSTGLRCWDRPHPTPVTGSLGFLRWLELRTAMGVVPLPLSSQPVLVPNFGKPTWDNNGTPPKKKRKKPMVFLPCSQSYHHVQSCAKSRSSPFFRNSDYRRIWSRGLGLGRLLILQLHIFGLPPLRSGSSRLQLLSWQPIWLWLT